MKAIVSFCCITFIVLVTTACTDQRENGTTMLETADSFAIYRKQTDAALYGADSIRYFFKDSLALNEGGRNNATHFNLADEDMWPSFQFSLYTDNKLFLYNVEQRRSAYTIDLSNVYADDKRVDCYVKHNIIYTLKWMEDDLKCFDLDGHLLHTYRLPDTSRELSCTLTAFPAMSSFTLNKNNDMAMFMLPYLDPYTARQRVFSNQPIALLHFSKESVIEKNRTGIFPRAYLDHYYRETEYSFINVSDSCIAYMFRIYPEICLQNTYTNEIKKHTIKDLPANNVAHYTEDPAQIQRFSYTQEYELKNDSYNGLAFDKSKNRYYVFRSLGISPQHEDGTLAMYTDHPMILYIIDGISFSVIRKVYCGTAGKYWYYRPIIYNSKLFLLQRTSDKKGAPVTIDIYEIP